MTTAQQHRAASHFVAALKAPWIPNPPESVRAADRRFSTTLEFDSDPDRFYRVGVTFQCSTDKNSEFVFVRSTNWCFENEPGGWLRREDAVTLYHQVRAQAGFTITRKFVDGQEVSAAHRV